MIAGLVSALAHEVLAAIRQFGYLGIGVLMALESACIPIPSEVIMTFSGYLVSTQALGFWGVIGAGTAGSLAGSLAAYALGAWGGPPVIATYGRYVLLSPRDLERAHAWFGRYGQAAVFLARLVPVVRTFISLPAGVSRMPLLPFILYSTAGSILWCAALAWAGWRLGAHWDMLSPYMRVVDDCIAGIALAAGLVFAIRRWRHRAR